MELEIIARILWAIIFIILYIVIGFGPGFLIGMTIANRFVGRGQPTRVERHKELIEKAARHNSQWHPDHERWKH